MLKDMLLRYAAYNIWANQHIVKTVATLSEKQIQKDLGSSFPNIYKTLLHMYQAEKLWWMRIQMMLPATLSEKDKQPSTSDLLAYLVQQSELWPAWLQKQSESDLQSFFNYKNLKGESFVQPFWEVQMHIFNHASFHRGQIVTMLRQLGVTNIPATDFVVYTRETQGVA